MNLEGAGIHFQNIALDILKSVLANTGLYFSVLLFLLVMN